LIRDYSHAGIIDSRMTITLHATSFIYFSQHFAPGLQQDIPGLQHDVSLA
jgi:hypothetical protein